jgi:hypothetical protein
MTCVFSKSRNEGKVAAFVMSTAFSLARVLRRLSEIDLVSSFAESFFGTASIYVSALLIILLG